MLVRRRRRVGAEEALALAAAARCSLLPLTGRLWLTIRSLLTLLTPSSLCSNPPSGASSLSSRSWTASWCSASSRSRRRRRACSCLRQPPTTPCPRRQSWQSGLARVTGTARSSSRASLLGRRSFCLGGAATRSRSRTRCVGVGVVEDGGQWGRCRKGLQRADRRTSLAFFFLFSPLYSRTPGVPPHPGLRDSRQDQRVGTLPSQAK